MFKLSPASHQGQGDTRLTLTSSVVQNSKYSYIILVSDWDCLIFFRVFVLYCTKTLWLPYIYIYIYVCVCVFVCGAEGDFSIHTGWFRATEHSLVSRLFRTTIDPCPIIFLYYPSICLNKNTVRFNCRSSFFADYSSSPWHQDWLWC
jgi:hypothetical protein